MQAQYDLVTPPVPSASVVGTVKVTLLLEFFVTLPAATFGAVMVYVPGQLAALVKSTPGVSLVIKADGATAVIVVPTGPADGVNDDSAVACAADGATSRAATSAPVVSPAQARPDLVLDKRMRGPPTVCRPFVDGWGPRRVIDGRAVSPE